MFVMAKAHLDPFRIHFVVLFRLRPIQPCVPLLAYEQIWKVDLLKFKFDWLDEFGGHEFRCLCACSGLASSHKTSAKKAHLNALQ